MSFVGANYRGLRDVTENDLYHNDVILDINTGILTTRTEQYSIELTGTPIKIRKGRSTNSSLIIYYSDHADTYGWKYNDNLIIQPTKIKTSCEPIWSCRGTIYKNGNDLVSFEGTVIKPDFFRERKHIAGFFDDYSYIGYDNLPGNGYPWVRVSPFQIVSTKKMAFDNHITIAIYDEQKDVLFWTMIKGLEPIVDNIDENPPIFEVYEDVVLVTTRSEKYELTHDRLKKIDDCESIFPIFNCAKSARKI